MGVGTAWSKAMNSLSKLILILVWAGISGCGHNADASYQQVVGKLAYIGEPPAQRQIKLLSPAGSGCAGAGAQATTDPSGAFKLTRTIADDRSPQDDLLCVETPQGWVRVWEHSYEPAPATLDIFCAGTVGAWKCEVFGDGVSLARTSE